MIKLLDDLTINKIAAGEVVERPSSVVKELVENSIDANSTKIVIEIVDGGKKIIKISDNGDGIDKDEVEKSFLRHATSKITKIEDLYNLYSLGFRGEALASISAVSKLEMITKKKDSLSGVKIILEGSKIISKEEIAATNGTTITISDIFFNTPARQKFLKSTHAETINISDLINKLAIGNENISFKYINNNKIMLNSPGDNNLLSAIRSIYGKDITNNLVKIDYECTFFKVYGYIGNNNVYRTNKNLQHIYINNRFVKSKIILDAINEAYKGLIPINKCGVCFLKFEIDPNKIDVNIHPTKLEVKFEQEQQIYVSLKDYLKQQLISSNLIGKYEVKEKVNDLPIKKEEIKRENFKVIEIDYEKAIPFDTLENALLKEEIKKEEIKQEEVSKDFKEVINKDEVKKEELIEEQEKFFNSNFDLSEYRIVGQIFNTYIILQRNESMYLLDQHAAHERVLYERYMKSFKSKSIDMQMLLEPIVLEISNIDLLKVEKNIDIFKKFGFEIEIFGNNHIIIRSVATIFGIPTSQRFILEIIDNIEEINSSYDLFDDKFASMACKAAIKANDKIENLEINSLFSQMKECVNPFTCPHGRPILVEITKKEIEKMFKRIM